MLILAAYMLQAAEKEDLTLNYIILGVLLIIAAFLFFIVVKRRMREQDDDYDI